MQFGLIKDRLCHLFVSFADHLLTVSQCRGCQEGNGPAKWV
jgi:hypothetical protein